MNEIMKQRFRMYRREGGVFYVFDRVTGKRESLETDDPATADRLLHAKNESQQQPQTILLGKAYRSAHLVDGKGCILRAP